MRQDHGGTATGRGSDGFCPIDFRRFWTPSCSFAGDSLVIRDRSCLFKDGKAVFWGGDQSHSIMRHKPMGERSQCTGEQTAITK